MQSISDLVKDSRLETSFPNSSICSPDGCSHDGPKVTSHFFTETGRDAHQRSIRRREIWKREAFVGGGAFASVWLERCVDAGFGRGAKGHGEDFPAVRAVKQIRRSTAAGESLDYYRELEAIAKFSHRKVHLRRSRVEEHAADPVAVRPMFRSFLWLVRMAKCTSHFYGISSARRLGSLSRPVILITRA
jgi:hypothetical protein